MTWRPPRGVCPKCGATYAGKQNHCTLPGCCNTFSTPAVGDLHRVGPFLPGQRRCLTPDEMRAKGMQQGSDGVWRDASHPHPQWRTS